MTENFFKHEYVRDNKLNPTKSEKKFKNLMIRILEEKFSLYDLNVLYQVPIKHHRGFYILDCYIPVLKIVFEIDGGYHYNSDQLDRDLKRDTFLEHEKEFTVYHIANQKLLNSRMKRELKSRLINILKKHIELRKHKFS